jgi:hypothetical protein
MELVRIETTKSQWNFIRERLQSVLDHLLDKFPRRHQNECSWPVRQCELGLGPDFILLKPVYDWQSVGHSLTRASLGSKQSAVALEQVGDGQLLDW